VTEPRDLPAKRPDSDSNRNDLQTELILALRAIARGRTDCGRPLNGEAARQVARRALNECGIGWGENPRGGPRLFQGGAD
jgi:hypothetical protein